MGCRDWGSGKGKAVQGRGCGCRVWGGHSLLLSDLHDLQAPPSNRARVLGEPRSWEGANCDRLGPCRLLPLVAWRRSERLLHLDALWPRG